MKKFHKRKPFLFMICIAFSTALFLIHSPTSISKVDNSTNYAEKTYTKSTEVMAETYSTTASTTKTVVQKKETIDSAIPTFTNVSSPNHADQVASRGAEREMSAAVTQATNTQTPTIDESKSSDSSAIVPSEKEVVSAVKEVTSDVKNDTSDVDSVDLLARLICAEAQGEPYEAKVAVGAVVINRVQSGAWASTISDVIYQNINGYYQFTPVENGWINKPADPESIKAAKAALSGNDPTNGAQFYYDDKATNTWILSKPVSVQIGHMFYAFNE